MKKEENKKAILLRRRGFSLNEISSALKISKGTASAWLRNVQMENSAIDRINGRIKNGRIRSDLVRGRIRTKAEKELIKDNKNILTKIILNKNINKLHCSLLYWCEGNKDNNSIRFTNSDPRMIRSFLTLLRKGYDIDERRLRVCMHLHDYHSEKKQKAFWSRITNIPKNQFIKTYKKHHTGIRTRNGYEGCISVRYGDNKLARKLNNLWQLFAKKYGGA